MTTELKNLYEALRSQILSCPHCSKLQRGSDLILQHTHEVKGDWFDQFKEAEAEAIEVKNSNDAKVSELKAKTLKAAQLKASSNIAAQLYDGVSGYNPKDIHVSSFGTIIYDGLTEGRLNKIHIVNMPGNLHYDDLVWKVLHVDVDIQEIIVK